jgi:hypothetical protein
MEAHENQREANLSSRAGETLDFAVAGKWIKLKHRGFPGGRGGGPPQHVMPNSNSSEGEIWQPDQKWTFF